MSQELAGLQSDIDFVDSGRAVLDNAQDTLTLLAEEDDEALLLDTVNKVADFDKLITAKEVELKFDGPYDAGPAIVMIQAGAGGTDAQDWAQMLERMYMRFAERRGWKVLAIDRSTGDTAGIKSSTFEVRGRFAYGVLSHEHGVHRLVRQSPFNSDSLRQTSFARVEVIPKIEEQDAPVIDEKDLEIDTFRAGGAGGQHVNKTSSAVRIRHIPTGVVVKCQNERSQGQNKAMAMSILQSKLVVLAKAQHVSDVRELRGEVKDAAWGNQIRSYVLHPYTMVKDHRTKKETSNTTAVLDGDLSFFE